MQGRATSLTSLLQPGVLTASQRHVFCLHSNQPPTYRAPCQISLSLIHVSLPQSDPHLPTPFPASVLSHSLCRLAPLCPSLPPLRHICLLPIYLRLLPPHLPSPTPLRPILLTRGLHLLPLSPALPTWYLRLSVLCQDPLILLCPLPPLPSPLP